MATYRNLECHIRGLTPSLMNNGRKANPLDEYATAIREIIKSKPRGGVLTEEQVAEVSRLEFLGALYVDDNGAPCWPGENLEAMLIAGAKKSTDGPKAKVGIIIDGNFPLVFDGPKDADALWADGRFSKTGPAKVQKARVMRTRPIFPAWELKFTISYDPDQTDKKGITKWLKAAGALVGLSDWRPKHGRFEVVSVKEAA